MDPSNKTALELLEQLRAERSELDTLIKGLEKRLGVVQSGADGESLWPGYDG